MNGERRKAMADQLTTVSKARLRERLDRINAAEPTAVARAIGVRFPL